MSNTVPIISTITMSDYPLFSATRVRNNTPFEYRLVQRDSCNYVLQGGFQWSEGLKTGIEWRDLLTIDEQLASEIS
jgi:hypothetical protein